MKKLCTWPQTVAGVLAGSRLSSSSRHNGTVSGRIEVLDGNVLHRYCSLWLSLGALLGIGQSKLHLYLEKRYNTGIRSSYI